MDDRDLADAMELMASEQHYRARARRWYRWIRYAVLLAVPAFAAQAIVLAVRPDAFDGPTGWHRALADPIGLPIIAGCLIAAACLVAAYSEDCAADHVRFLRDEPADDDEY